MIDIVHTQNILEEEARPVDESAADDNERIVEATLRPEYLHEFIGQEHIKEPLSIAITAAESRKEPMEHTLLYGNPGLGKTTLAGIIAKEMGAQIRMTAGPALERAGDLAAILSNLGRGDALFIDEIHRMNKTIEEILYTAMEDYAIDIIVGKGPAARTLRMPVERFTLIGATTKVNLLSGPFRDRFGHVFHLNFYEPDDIGRIVERSARILGMDIPKDVCAIIAERSRRTPRVANRLLKRVRDYAEVRHGGRVDEGIAREALGMLSIDAEGLDAVDRKILAVIIEKFSGGPVGLHTIASAVGEDMDTVETVYEPYLLQLGMLERTLRGRCATRLAYDHLGKEWRGLV